MNAASAIGVWRLEDVRQTMIQINCPSCGQRLFDLDPGGKAGDETIKIKCSRCRAVTAIKLRTCSPSK